MSPWWRRRWAPWLIVLIGAVSTGPLAFVLRMSVPEPGDFGINCGGIGFGETPCGWDAVGLIYALIGVPYGLAVVALVGILELGRRRTQMLRVWTATTAAIFPWLIGAWGALGA